MLLVHYPTKALDLLFLVVDEYGPFLDRIVLRIRLCVSIELRTRHEDMEITQHK
jgi:hypothetical protein